MRITLVKDNAALAQGIAYRLQDAGHAADLLEYTYGTGTDV